MIRYLQYLKACYLDEKAQSIAEYAVLLTFVFIIVAGMLDYAYGGRSIIPNFARVFNAVYRFISQIG